MVTTFLIQMVAGIAAGLFSLIPAWGIDTSALDSVNSAVVAAGSLDGWVPETFVFVCLGIMLGTRLWLFFWNAIQWAYHLIPFNGG